MQEKESNNNWVKKLQKRWGVKSAWQVVVILIVFALTGFSSLYVKRPIYQFLNLDPESFNVWQKVLAIFFIVLPVYQLLLLFYGTLLGQFQFFWNFEKRMFGRIGKLFTFWRRK